MKVIRTLALVAAALLAGCAPAQQAQESTGTWPRTITHELGDTVIPAKPQRVVSTSVVVAGTLLAANAPLVASAATTPGGDNHPTGFFSWWGDVAVERGVQVLYDNLKFDIEAVAAARPDLIVLSTVGGDSTKDQYDQLSQIAPTIAVNGSNKTWQELARVLSQALGNEAEVEAIIADFDKLVADTKSAITIPEGPVNAIVFSGVQYDAAFAKPTGPHAGVLAALGFTVQPAPDEYDTATQARQDFAFVSLENAVKALTAPTVLLIDNDNAGAADLMATEVFQNAEAVKAGKVFALGTKSFKIDYFSSLDIIKEVRRHFGND